MSTEVQKHWKSLQKIEHFVDLLFPFQKKDEPLRPEQSPSVEPREMFAHVKQTGDIIRVNLEKGRPEKFR
jgi:hypothetical protein